MIETDTIYNEDCLTTLGKMQDETVDLIVTSPPYNKNHWIRNKSKNNGGRRVIEYDAISDDLPQDEYIRQQKQVLKECQRVLKPHGSIFYNHVDILHDHLTIHPSFVYDFPVKQVLIWDRTNTPKLDKSYFFPVTEYVFWIKKTSNSKPLFHRDRVSFRKNILRIPPATKNPHPAPFPLSLVNNFVQGCSEEGMVVYDPYMGSGTTAIACILNGRKYIGSEISSRFCQDARKKIAEHEAQQVLPFAL